MAWLCKLDPLSVLVGALTASVFWLAVVAYRTRAAYSVYTTAETKSAWAANESLVELTELAKSGDKEAARIILNHHQGRMQRVWWVRVLSKLSRDKS